MSSLPILGAPCTSEELEARFSELRAMQIQHEQQNKRALRGALTFWLTLVAGVACLCVYDAQPFTHASMGLLAISGTWCLYRVTDGRWPLFWRGIALLICALLLYLGMQLDVVPSPTQLLAALDLRTHPGTAIPAALLSLLGVGGALMWDSARAPGRPGPIEAQLLVFVEQLSRPLLQDAAFGARCMLRLSPFVPDAEHWTESSDGTRHLLTLERLICELMIPLERGEHVLLQVSEKVVTRTSHRTNPRGKLKVKPKGYARSVQARLSWTLRTSAHQSSDLTQQLQSHLSRACPHNGEVELSARSAQEDIEVRVRRQVRTNAGGYPGARGYWINVDLLHECARFLAQTRAGLGR